MYEIKSDKNKNIIILKKDGTTLDYIVMRSLTNYVFDLLCYDFYMIDNTKLYSVLERRVHLTYANPIGFVQNVHCIMRTIWDYHVQPRVSVLWDDW